MSEQTGANGRKPKPVKKALAKPKESFGATAIALAKNPLGVIALFVVLVESVALGFVSFGSTLTHDEKMPIIYFIVLFPCFVFGGFLWLVAWHSGKLFAPSEYSDERNYAALQRGSLNSLVVSGPSKKEESQKLQSVTIEHNDPTPLKIESQPEPDLFSDYINPRPDWNKKDYDFGAFQAVSQGNAEAVAELDQAYTAYVDTNQNATSAAISKAEWSAFLELLRIQFSKGGQLSKLREIAATIPESADMHDYIAEGLLVFREYRQAAESFERAESFSPDNRNKIVMLGKAAVAHCKGGSLAAANKAMTLLRRIGENHSSLEIDVVKAIRDFAVASKDDQTGIAAMERIVELDPSDSRTRWNLAFQHSNLGQHDLSLIHYLEIPWGERSASAWNNIGVEYNQFKISSKAVKAFQKSFKLGESIAGSNLAEELLSVGFLDEAKKLCEEAIAMPDPHANTAQTLWKIKNTPEEDDKRETALHEKAREKLDFFKTYGRAVRHIEPTDLSGAWQTPDCIISGSVSDGIFRAEGNYQRNTGGGLLGALYPTTLNPPESMKITVEGKVIGRSIRGTVIRSRVFDTTTILSSADAGAEVIFIISDDGVELKGMELVSSGGAQTLSSGFMNYYVWTKITEVRADDTIS